MLSELGLWLSFNAIILLIAAEILSVTSGKRFKISKKKLGVVTLTISIVFMVVIFLKGYETWTTLQP